jgi:uncharacterized protein (TIGR00255 family)
MASSMTGLGIGEKKSGGQTICVELRSVNNRYLEVSSRLPAVLSPFEPAIKEIVREAVSRGKLYVNISVLGGSNSYAHLRINKDAVIQVGQILNSLRKEAHIEDPLRLEHLLQYPEIFENADQNHSEEMTWENTKAALIQALEDLKKMRRKEGRVLVEDILARLKLLKKSVDEIDKIAKTNLPETHQKMVERVKKLVHGEAVNEERLYSEIALMADKLDVTEECTRLKSHHQLFREIIGSEDEVGKKLNFLLQEMNREVNTISTKANHVLISHIVVSMKDEIEKLREQVQNLE